MSQLHEVVSEVYGEEEFLRDRGVPLESETSRQILELEKQIRAFVDKYPNSAPERTDAVHILSVLRALRVGPPGPSSSSPYLLRTYGDSHNPRIGQSAHLLPTIFEFGSNSSGGLGKVRQFRGVLLHPKCDRRFGWFDRFRRPQEELFDIPSVGISGT
jgi:hypothetical protein